MNGCHSPPAHLRLSSSHSTITMPRSTPRRTAIACTRCRRLKVKCVMQDANSSCTKCTREKRECRYIPVSEQMGIPERIAGSKPRRTRRQDGSSSNPARASSCSSDESGVSLSLLPITPPPHSAHLLNLEDMRFSPLPAPASSHHLPYMANSASGFSSSYRYQDHYDFDPTECNLFEYGQTSTLDMEFPVGCALTCPVKSTKFSGGSLPQQMLEPIPPHPRNLLMFEPTRLQPQQYLQQVWNPAYASQVSHRYDSQRAPSRHPEYAQSLYTAW